MPPRCCTEITGEFDPCYASVLMYGQTNLKAAVEALEEHQPLISCFTAWCSRCRGVYMLTPDLSSFPAPSAHHTHKLGLLRKLRADGVYHGPTP